MPKKGQNIKSTKEGSIDLLISWMKRNMKCSDTTTEIFCLAWSRKLDYKIAKIKQKQEF